jgi:hypothetical protein
MSLVLFSDLPSGDGALHGTESVLVIGAIEPPYPRLVLWHFLSSCCQPLCNRIVQVAQDPAPELPRMPHRRSSVAGFCP